jgi:predicted nuclease with TOPRIM domain
MFLWNFCSEENVQLKQLLEEKTNALELLIQEHQAAKAELEQALTKLKGVEDENKQLVERLMQAKMVEAEKLNEVPCCLFLVLRLHLSSIRLYKSKIVQALGFAF